MKQLKLRANSHLGDKMRKRPWIYHKEIKAGLRDVKPGEEVVLVDEDGAFLASGYAHPTATIAFHRMSQSPELSAFAAENIQEKFYKAFQLRQNAGLLHYSCRLLYAEGDAFPGLIIDRYLGPERDHQVFVLQPTTAGVDTHFDLILEEFKKFVATMARAQKWPDLNHSEIVLAKNSTSRRREGLSVEDKSLLTQVGLDLSPFLFVVQSANNSDLFLRANLLTGQKTGFFFDQRQNIQTFVEHLSRHVKSRKTGDMIRVLDLCCYVGQWGAHIAKALQGLGYKVDLTLMDSSQSALQLAEDNVREYCDSVKSLKGDVLTGLNGFKADFDVVVCDPPAFIKQKSHRHSGIAAYTKLNQQALALLKPNGFFVSCSCSALLSEDEFVELLSKATSRAKREVQWVARGVQAVDHPALVDFESGEYLKARLGIVKK